MIHATIQTRTMAAAEKLTTQLMENRLLLFPALDTDHEELIWSNGGVLRASQCLLPHAKPGASVSSHA